jgi:DNA-directed RNA polymerase specialized sigma24 family protein
MLRSAGLTPARGAMSTTVLFESLVGQTLERKPEAARELVRALYPVVQARVVRVLARAGRLQGQGRSPQIDDFIQDTFEHLFENGGRALRAWAPERGLSLPNFVGLLTERLVISVLRSGRRSPYTEDPQQGEVLEAQLGGDESVEIGIVGRDLLAALLDRLRASLSPLGTRLFELVFVEERPVEEIVLEMKMSTDAVYAWRSRLRRQVDALLRELANEGAGVGSRTPTGSNEEATHGS